MLQHTGSLSTNWNYSLIPVTLSLQLCADFDLTLYLLILITLVDKLFFMQPNLNAKLISVMKLYNLSSANHQKLIALKGKCWEKYFGRLKTTGYGEQGEKESELSRIINLGTLRKECQNVQRMNQDSIANTVDNGQLPSEQPVVKPKKRWKDKYHTLGCRNWQVAAEHREVWRTRIQTAQAKIGPAPLMIYHVKLSEIR